MEEIRLNKYIALAGVCSRRNADTIILEGRVKVNGQTITELGTKVTCKDKVEVDSKEIRLETNKIYVMLNKPKGYVTTSKEQFNRPSVLDLINVSERIFPIGRLDMDSEGLLLLTNDGDFTNEIIHPTKHVSKTYEVELKSDIYEEKIKLLKRGVDIGGYTTKPAEIGVISERKILITIYEGKNRQIRRMCEAIDNKVVSLKRISIGKLDLGNLKTGEYRLLNKDELNKIFK